MTASYAPSDGTRWAWLVGPLLVAVVSLAVFVPWRPDRQGHVLAGFGVTLVVAWMVSLIAKGRAGAIVLATFGCIGLGVLAEIHVFPLGGYDQVDVEVQSVGALLAGLALVFGRAGDPEHDAFDRERLRPAPYGRTVLVLGGLTLAAGAWRAFG